MKKSERNKAENGPGMKMIPLAVRVKHEIQNDMNEARRNLQLFREWKEIDPDYAKEYAEKFMNLVLNLYEVMRNKIPDTKDTKIYNSLKNLEKKLGESIKYSPQHFKNWLNYFSLIHKMLHEFGLDVPEMAPPDEEEEGWE